MMIIIEKYFENIIVFDTLVYEHIDIDFDFKW